jgi:DNA-binding response OmpR family regulator
MILVMQSKRQQRQQVCQCITELGMHPIEVATTEQVFATLGNATIDLLIADVQLTGTDGLAFCRQVREQYPQLAIIIVAEKDSPFDRTLGIEFGADDYVGYPFYERELQARIRAQLRRSACAHHSDTSQLTLTAKTRIGALVVDAEQHTIEYNQTPLSVTATEFSLLYYLASNPNRVFSREQLLDAIRGYQHSGYEHTINSHINRLRSKLDIAASCGKIIETVWGVGYKLNMDKVKQMEWNPDFLVCDIE